MKFRIVPKSGFSKGDLVHIKSRPPEENYCIIGLRTTDDGQQLALLKALFNDVDIIEKPIAELNSLLIKGLL